MSPLALWFFIGSIVAIYVVITDFYLAKKNKLAMYKLVADKHEFPDCEKFYKVWYPFEVTLWTLLGPSSIYFYFKRTKRLTKESRKISANL